MLSFENHPMEDTQHSSDVVEEPNSTFPVVDVTCHVGGDIHTNSSH